MKRHLLILLCFAFPFLTSVSAQDVWPGDVNNNGAVSAVDLLYWGLAYNSNGIPRAEISSEWQAHPIDEFWNQDFPDGINYAYADCNGDGFIDEDDFDDAIKENFGLEHGTISSDGYVNGNTGNAPKLVLEPSATVVSPGATIDIALRLDDTDMPIDSFYGIAFTMSYTAELLAGDDGPDFDMIEDNWIGADNAYVEDLYQDNYDPGRAALGITRTNQISISTDTTEIGTFSVVIVDIIVGLYLDTFRLQIDSVRLIDNNLNTIAVVPDTVDIIVAQKHWPAPIQTDIVPIEPTDYQDAPLQVYPMFAEHTIHIKTDFPLYHTLLIDPLGRVIQRNEFSSGSMLNRLEYPSLPPGVYLLQVEGQDQILTKKIFIPY